MKNLRYIIPFLLVSCELVVPVDQPDFEPSIVVGSFIGPDTTIVVNLTSDRYVLERAYEFDPIEDATVLLYEDDQLMGALEEIEYTREWDLNNPVPGIYGLDYRPVAGRTYRLEISKEGYRSVQATDQLPLVSPRFEILNVEKDEFSDGEIDIRIYDEPGEDFYEVLVFLSVLRRDAEFDDFGNIVKDSVWRADPSPISLYTENIVVEEHNNSIFPDNLFEGRSYDLELEGYFSTGSGFGDFDPEPILTVELRRVSEAYYNYVNSSNLQNWVTGDPFAEPVQAFTNVENGRGVLGSYVATRHEVSF